MLYRGCIHHVSSDIAEEQGETRPLLHNIDQAHLLADCAIMVAYCCERHMRAVREAGAVDQDASVPAVVFIASGYRICPAGLFLFPGQLDAVFEESVVGRKKHPLGIFRSDFRKELADPLG